VLKHSDRARLVSCYSPDADERATFARRFSVSPAESFEAVLADRNVDAVLLATPHSVHAPQVIEAAAAGKHVFVEKPFTLTVESARAAAKAAEAAGVVLAVGHNRRLSAGARALKRLVEEGAFGALLHVEANYSIDSAMRYRPGAWRADRREAAGGALASLGLHMVDTIGWLFGPVERVRCSARRVAVPVDIDDVTVGFLQFRSGLTASLVTMFASPLISHLRIAGTACIAEAFEDFGRIALRCADGASRTLKPAQVDTVAQEIGGFLRACRKGGDAPVPTADAIHNVAVLEAMVASARADSAWVKVQNAGS
jgi:predicted dehydrogenase